MDARDRTPSQTIGPYFAVGLPWTEGPYVVPPGTLGGFWIRGRILDGNADPVPDAMVETWQADPEGRFHSGAGRSGAVPGFRGFGRASVSPEGEYGIFTVKPGHVSAERRATEAPHVDAFVFARGLLKQVVTRIYFPDEESANDLDPVLGSLTDNPDARATLIAIVSDDGYRFDVRLQGDRETVFFEV
jgi:protocatechuate 3,4-dioxygenase alpha subunit